MSSENYRSASKSHDPGWNDPPKVTSTSGVAGTVLPKPLLNKRVPFPLQKPPTNPSSPTELAASPGKVPPSSTPTPLPLIPKSIPTGSDGTPVVNIPEAPTELPTQDELLVQIRTVFDEFAQQLEETRRADVQKRVNLIYEQWTERMLPAGLEKHIYDFSTALKEKDDIRANVVHRSIVCDYGSKCALWGPALRQLIFALQKCNEQEVQES
uniref:SRA1/Sec31 domain-containing protein n=1 Tax=Anopheles farauti TaxID=69004 RepID=A0A182QLE8_9DIPT